VVVNIIFGATRTICCISRSLTYENKSLKNYLDLLTWQFLERQPHLVLTYGITQCLSTSRVRCCCVTVYYETFLTNILMYVQQDETLHSLFHLVTTLHVSGSTTTHHQERRQLYLQYLVFVAPLLLPAAIVEELEPVRLCCG